MSSDAATTIPVSQFNIDRQSPAAVAGLTSLGGSRIQAIDGLRALAMLMVFTYHVWQFSGSPDFRLAVAGIGVPIGAIIAQFAAGVDLFMVLSGFCLFYPVAKASPAALRAWSWRAYAMRRVRRIVPPYYAAIVYVTLLPVVLVIVWRLLGQPAKWQGMYDFWQYVTHALFIHTLFLPTWDGIQGVFWSLGLEAQFYLVFPAVVFAFRRYGIGVVWMMIGVSVLYRIGVGLFVDHTDWRVPFLFSITFLGRWMQFAAGMYAAWLVVRRNRDGACMSAGAGNLLIVTAIAAYTFALVQVVQNVRWFPLRDILLAVAFAAAIVPLCTSRFRLRREFECRPVAWLGLISYSIFLIHQNTIYYAGELLKRADLNGPARFALFMTAGLALVVAVSYVFFRLFEAPFLQRAAARPERTGNVVAMPSPMSPVS